MVNTGSVFSSKFLLYIQVITTKVVSSVVVAVVADSQDINRTRRVISTWGRALRGVREQQISFHPCVFFYNNSIHKNQQFINTKNIPPITPPNQNHQPHPPTINRDIFYCNLTATLCGGKLIYNYKYL